MATNLKPVGEVSQLCLYPVKSTYVLNVSAAECTEVGLHLPEQDVYDRIWGQQTEGIDCGDEAGEWVSKHLHKPGTRLLLFTGIHNKRTLQQAEELFREMNVELPQENPKLTFADSSTYSMLSEASVEDLNTRLENPVSVKNFRPNIVIKGRKAYEEDNFGKVKIGSAEFKIFSKDSKCSLTTVNTETGARDPKFEPVKILRTYRPGWEEDGVKHPFFSVYMVLTKAGNVKIGDPVYQINC